MLGQTYNRNPEGLIPEIPKRENERLYVITGQQQNNTQLDLNYEIYPWNGKWGVWENTASKCTVLSDADRQALADDLLPSLSSE